MDKIERIKNGTHTMKGEAMISMWAILELFVIMAVLYIFFGFFHISLADVFTTYSSMMFNWVTSGLTSLFKLVISIIASTVSSISDGIKAILCAAIPLCK